MKSKPRWMKGVIKAAKVEAFAFQARRKAFRKPLANHAPEPVQA